MEPFNPRAEFGLQGLDNDARVVAEIQRLAARVGELERRATEATQAFVRLLGSKGLAATYGKASVTFTMMTTGSTVATVTHGLPDTPKLVLVTPLQVPAYVSAVVQDLTATNFKIQANQSTAGYAGAADIQWIALT